MRIIGSRCYVYNSNITKGHKVDPRSEIQYLVGYTPTGYKTYNPKTMKTSPQCIVSIDESILYKDDYPSNSCMSNFQLPLPEYNNKSSSPCSTNKKENLSLHQKEGGVSNSKPTTTRKKVQNKELGKGMHSISTRTKTGTKTCINYKDLI